jgi:hypothetical protein
VAPGAGAPRLCLQLDPRMAFEALILQRLPVHPDRSAPEWLRGLLVQGFLAECRQRREADGEACDRPGAATRRPGNAFAGWLTERTPTPHAPPAEKPNPSDPQRPAVAPKAKPFAHLRKVIG